MKKISFHIDKHLCPIRLIIPYEGERVQWHVSVKNQTYPQKPALFVVAPLLGVKNGQIVGMR
jgi:hypothetical protein